VVDNCNLDMLLVHKASPALARRSISHISCIEPMQNCA
jgi:hypothetical protein